MPPFRLPESSRSSIPSSFRDPSGFLFFQDGTLYRRVNHSYRRHYEFLLSSGLYKALAEIELLIPHEEVLLDCDSRAAYKTLKPEVIPFVSYPYEWSFSQLKDAALLTLEAQKLALRFGMSLKDASAYNVQFKGGKPVLIDTLSFERCSKSATWVAYRQFCQHFLAPLALMSRVDVRLGQLLKVHIDGVPLDLASRLLSWKKYCSLGLFVHLHAHALAQRRFGVNPPVRALRQANSSGLLGLIDNLEATVRRLSWQPQPTRWANYYSHTNYVPSALQEKVRIVTQWLTRMVPQAQCVWDFGANTGLFSRLASQRGTFTVSMDVDPSCVEISYKECRRQGENQLLPLLLDLTNPSAALGWENRERMSLLDRGPVDVAFALAIVHHLAISNNLPLSRIAEFFSRCCKRLVIEFVPKTDSQVQRMLTAREDVFHEYNEEAFEHEFARFFALREAIRIPGHQRTLYWMERVN